jgi:hypothetical protein
MEGDPELIEDSEFCQQLLKEFLEGPQVCSFSAILHLLLFIYTHRPSPAIGNKLSDIYPP